MYGAVPEGYERYADWNAVWVIKESDRFLAGTEQAACKWSFVSSQNGIS